MDSKSAKSEWKAEKATLEEIKSLKATVDILHPFSAGGLRSDSPEEVERMKEQFLDCLNKAQNQLNKAEQQSDLIKKHSQDVYERIRRFGKGSSSDKVQECQKNIVSSAESLKVPLSKVSSLLSSAVDKARGGMLEEASREIREAQDKIGDPSSRDTVLGELGYHHALETESKDALGGVIVNENFLRKLGVEAAKSERKAKKETSKEIKSLEKALECLQNFAALNFTSAEIKSLTKAQQLSVKESKKNFLTDVRNACNHLQKSKEHAEKILETSETVCKNLLKARENSGFSGALKCEKRIAVFGKTLNSSLEVLTHSLDQASAELKTELFDDAHSKVLSVHGNLRNMIKKLKALYSLETALESFFKKENA